MISIVVTAYNIERYLSRCIDSIILHVKCDYEVILVDDGSTDNSARICDEYAGRYDNIRVIHQDNRGVSVARNRGIEEAKGEWLWFVDGDDYIENDVDIDEEKADKDMMVMGCVWEEANRCVQVCAEATCVPYNTWRCLFRRERVVEKCVRFAEGRRYAEDQEFVISYMLATGCYGQLGVIAESIYHYTVREGSAVTQKGRKLVMMRDIWAVWCKTIWEALRRGELLSPWVMNELKRMAKTILVTAVR